MERIGEATGQPEEFASADGAKDDDEEAASMRPNQMLEQLYLQLGMALGKKAAA